MSIPRYLYRYEPCEKIRIDSFLHGSLWLSKPCHFDDELDCNIRVDRQVTYLEVLKLRDYFLEGGLLFVRRNDLLRSIPTFATVEEIQKSANLIFDAYKTHSEDRIWNLMFSGKTR